MKFSFSILIILIASYNYAQGSGFKYDKGTNIVYNKENPLFKVIIDSGVISIDNFNDSTLMFFLSKEMRNIIPSTKKNPDGSVFCKGVFFVGNKFQSVELPEGKSLSYYVKMVYNNKLISDNKLDTVAVKKFVNNTGIPYSLKYLVYDEKTKTFSPRYIKNN